MKECKIVIQLQSVTDGLAKVVAENELTLGISVKEGTASFFYAEKNGVRKVLAEYVEVSNLSTKKAKGFVGAVVGMYATSVG